MSCQKWSGVYYTKPLNSRGKKLSSDVWHFKMCETAKEVKQGGHVKSPSAQTLCKMIKRQMVKVNSIKKLPYHLSENIVYSLLILWLLSAMFVLIHLFTFRCRRIPMGIINNLLRLVAKYSFSILGEYIYFLIYLLLVFLFHVPSPLSGRQVRESGE